MSDRAALLAAVKAFPENDAPRLIFADWLDEHGDERDRDWAALIRWGCAPENRASVYHVGAEHACVTVAVANDAKRLIVPARHAFGVHSLHRGFYEAFSGTAADWLAHADALLAEHPVARVTLTTVPEVVPFVDALGWVYIRNRGRKTLLYEETDSPAYMLSCEWPGIEFELPQPVGFVPNQAGNGWDFASPSATVIPDPHFTPTPVPPVSMAEALVDGNVAGFQEYFTQQLNAMAQSLAVPQHLLAPNAGLAFSTWQQFQALNHATQDAFGQAAPLPPDAEE